MTPFGKPVEPEVKSSFATLSGSIAAWAASTAAVGLAAARSEKRVVLRPAGGAPVTTSWAGRAVIDERADGVHLSFDRLASLVAPYGSAEALRAAQELDATVEDLLTSAAQSRMVQPRKSA